MSSNFSSVITACHVLLMCIYINVGVMWEKEKDKYHTDMLPVFMVFGSQILFSNSVPDMYALYKQYFKMLRMKSDTSQMGHLV